MTSVENDSFNTRAKRIDILMTIPKFDFFGKTLIMIIMKYQKFYSIFSCGIVPTICWKLAEILVLLSKFSFSLRSSYIPKIVSYSTTIV